MLTEVKSASGNVSPEVIKRGFEVEITNTRTITQNRLEKLEKIKDALAESAASIGGGKEAAPGDRSGVLYNHTETAVVKFLKLSGSAEEGDAKNNIGSVRCSPLNSLSWIATASLQGAVGNEISNIAAALIEQVRTNAADNKTEALAALEKLSKLKSLGLLSQGEGSVELLGQMVAANQFAPAQTLLSTIKPANTSDNAAVKWTPPPWQLHPLVGTLRETALAAGEKAQESEPPVKTETSPSQFRQLIKQLETLQNYLLEIGQGAEAVRIGKLADKAVVDTIADFQPALVKTINDAAEKAEKFKDDAKVYTVMVRELELAAVVLMQLADANYIELDTRPQRVNTDLKSATALLLSHNKLATLLGVCAECTQAEGTAMPPWPENISVLKSSLELPPMRADASFFWNGTQLADFVQLEDDGNITINVIDSATGEAASFSHDGEDLEEVIRVESTPGGKVRILAENYVGWNEIWELAPGDNARRVSSFEPLDNDAVYNRELSRAVDWDGGTIRVLNVERRRGTFYKDFALFSGPAVQFQASLGDVKVADVAFVPESGEVVVLSTTGTLYLLQPLASKKGQGQAVLIPDVNLENFSAIPNDSLLYLNKRAGEKNILLGVQQSVDDTKPMYFGEMRLGSGGKLQACNMPTLSRDEKLVDVSPDGGVLATQYGDTICVWRNVGNTYERAGIINLPSEESLDVPNADGEKETHVYCAVGGSVLVGTAHPHLTAPEKLIRVRRYEVPAAHGVVAIDYTVQVSTPPVEGDPGRDLKAA